MITVRVLADQPRATRLAEARERSVHGSTFTGKVAPKNYSGIRMSSEPLCGDAGAFRPQRFRLSRGPRRSLMALSFFQGRIRRRTRRWLKPNSPFCFSDRLQSSTPVESGCWRESVLLQQIQSPTRGNNS